MTNDPANLESMLDAIGRTRDGTEVAPPAAFIGRVRHRRWVRRATRAGMGVLVVALVAGALTIMRQGASTPPEGPGMKPTYAVIDWPPLPPSSAGGPALPIRAGTRPTDPMAVGLLQ